MLLAIDVGNTNIVLAIYDGDTQLKQWRIETDTPLDNTFQGTDGITDIVICSVVPKVSEAIAEACQQHFDIKPTFITLENIDIDIQIDTPEKMGIDRMLGASAVVAHYQTPAIIVDLGTATTFDVIDEKGAHNGGVIAPGVNLSLSALESAAAQLPDIEIKKPANVIGKNTQDAMQSGIYWGYIGLIEGTVKRITEEMGVKPYIIATGGLAPLFDQGTDIFDIIDQDLIMKGLVHMHKVIENKRKH